MTSFGYGNNETVVAHGSTVLSACRDLSALTCVDAGPGAIAGGSVSYSDTGFTAGVAGQVAGASTLYNARLMVVDTPAAL